MAFTRSIVAAAAAALTTFAAVTTVATPAAVAADAQHTIDLLVVYPQSVVKARGSRGAADAAVRKSVEGMNKPLSDSRIDGHVNLAGTEVIDIPQGSHNELLKWVSEDSHVASLRDSHKADLVSLVVPGVAGIGHQPRLPLGKNTSKQAFSVVGNDWLEPIPRKGEAGVFAHELGHNLGAAHDWATVPDPGSTPEAHGFASPDGRVDIMAYMNSPICGSKCHRIAMYSNPDVTVEGKPFGTRGGDHPSDIASVFARTIPEVAAYR